MNIFILLLSERPQLYGVLNNIQNTEKMKNKSLFFCLCVGGKHRKNPEKSNTSKLDVQNAVNGSIAIGAEHVNSTVSPSTGPRRPQKVKSNVLRKMSHRRHMEKRCCRIGYRAAERRLFCRVDRQYSSKYRNMIHYARQRFQYTGKPSRGMQRLIQQFERHCLKPQLKGVFYKCCLDGIYSVLPKGRQ